MMERETIVVEYYGNNDWRDYHLAHHGIKGQKWGVRRFQNPDGSLTRAGKKHDKHRRAAEAADRDAADLKKRGYKKEAEAVQKVADRHWKKL